MQEVHKEASSKPGEAKHVKIGIIYVKGSYIYLVPFFPTVPRAYGKLVSRFKLLGHDFYDVDGIGKVKGLEAAIKACMSEDAKLFYPPRRPLRDIYLWPTDGNAESIASRIRQELADLGIEP
jgi:hypothetical protein